MTRGEAISALGSQALYDQVPVIPDCDGSCPGLRQLRNMAQSRGSWGLLTRVSRVDFCALRVDDGRIYATPRWKMVKNGDDQNQDDNLGAVQPAPVRGGRRLQPLPHRDRCQRPEPGALPGPVLPVTAGADCGVGRAGMHAMPRHRARQ